MCQICAVAHRYRTLNQQPSSLNHTSKFVAIALNQPSFELPAIATKDESLEPTPDSSLSS